MTPGERLITTVVALGGGLYLFSRSRVGATLAPTLAPTLASLGLPEPNTLTPAQQLALRAQQAVGSGPGNAPVVPGASFAGTPSGAAAIGGAIVGAAGIIDTAIFGVGIASGVATLGIGLAVAFFTYEYFKQQASIATNRARDKWTAQFVPLHQALGLTPLTAAQTKGSGPGDLEMAEVIFYFDHDSTQRLWHAVQGTQVEAQFAVAARAVDTFLTARGVPVTGP